MLYGQQGKEKNEALWLAKHKEIIDGYHPDIIWQDFNLRLISRPVLLEFLSYFYNQAAQRRQEVVATYKDGLNPKCAVLDYERGGPPDITENYWLTDDAISSSSWCYTEGIGYYSRKQILHGFIDRVSKNGNLLLNISPMADGTIPQEQKDLLLSMGEWLRKYGEAIYATRAWETYGEGPTKMGAAHGVMGPPSEGTALDVRYTRSKDNSTLYAILLGWDDGQREITLESLASDRIDGRKLKSAALINGKAGAYLPLTFEQDAEGLHVDLPERSFDELAYVIKLSFDGGIPAYDNFAALDTALHYRLVPGDNRGDLVLGADSVADRPKEGAREPVEPGTPRPWRLQAPEPRRPEPRPHLQPGSPRLLRCRSLREMTASTGESKTPVPACSLSPTHGARTSDYRCPRLRRPGPDVGLATNGSSSSSRWKLLDVCELKQEAFKPHAIPGVIEAEDYDTGCPRRCVLRSGRHQRGWAVSPQRRS